MEHNRGQAYALEGIIGAVIVVSALVLGLQAVDIAPWTGDDERQNTETRVEVADALAVAEDTGALREAVTCVGSDGTPDPEVAAAEDGTSELGTVLNRTLEGRYTYRIGVEYPTTDNETERVQIGPTPSLPNTDAVSVSRYVALSDSDPVYEVEDDSCTQNGRLGTVDDDEIYLEDQSGGALYAVVEVRVIAW